MANYLQVLVRPEDPDTLAEDGALHALHRRMVDETLWEVEQFDHFSYDLGSSFLGKDDPEKLRGIAGGWNDAIREETEAVIDAVNEKGGREFLLENPDDTLTYQYWHALATWTGCYHFGGNRLVSDEKESTRTTTLDPCQEAEIREHPEEWACLDVWYH